MKSPQILILNASLGSEQGNTSELLRRAQSTLAREVNINVLSLSETMDFADVEPSLAAADALVLGTGTYWDSWSHYLQRFLEEATPTEGTSLWLGKPAAVIVTMHSVGGKGVLSRLQGTLSTFGCVIPPMSGLVFSLVNQAALSAKENPSRDIWGPEDVDVICHNLIEALQPRPRYRAWDVDRGQAPSKWIAPTR